MKNPPLPVKRDWNTRCPICGQRTFYHGSAFNLCHEAPPRKPEQWVLWLLDKVGPVAKTNLLRWLAIIIAPHPMARHNADFVNWMISEERKYRLALEELIAKGVISRDIKRPHHLHFVNPGEE